MGFTKLASLIGALGFLSNCGVSATITPVSQVQTAGATKSDLLPDWVAGSYDASEFSCDGGTLLKASERSYTASLEVEAASLTLELGVNLTAEGATTSVDKASVTYTNVYAIQSSDIDEEFGVFGFTLGAAQLAGVNKPAAYSTIADTELATLASQVQLVQVFPTDSDKTTFVVTAASSPLCGSTGTLKFKISQR